jgi:hypothetical protein
MAALFSFMSQTFSSDIKKLEGEIEPYTIVIMVYGLLSHTLFYSVHLPNDSCQLHLKTQCFRLSQKRTLLFQ